MARLTLGALFVPAMLPVAFAQTYTTFDPPGSAGTFPLKINSIGDVVGDYLDSSGVLHGFLRTANGTITTFDPPGSAGTIATDINSNDEITGYAWINGPQQGFLRASDGTITIINVPSFTHTLSNTINSNGDIAGMAWNDATSNNPYGYTGFVLTHGGTLTTFGPVQWVARMNDSDEVTGNYVDELTGLSAGFVKPTGRAIATFKVPLELLTYSTGINDSGTTTGVASDEVCGEYCYGVRTIVGFVRASDGKLTVFQGADGAATYATAINASGEATGWYFTSQYHGFSRDASGAITTLDPPGSDTTEATSINDSGAITGYYYNGSYHGFILTP